MITQIEMILACTLAFTQMWMKLNRFLIQTMPPEWRMQWKRSPLRVALCWMYAPTTLLLKGTPTKKITDLYATFWTVCAVMCSYKLWALSLTINNHRLVFRIMLAWPLHCIPCDLRSWGLRFANFVKDFCHAFPNVPSNSIHTIRHQLPRPWTETPTSTTLTTAILRWLLSATRKITAVCFTESITSMFALWSVCRDGDMCST